jgi:hypothetical protein
MGQAARASVEANYSVGAWEETVVATLAGAPAPAAVQPPGRPRAPRAAARETAAAVVGGMPRGDGHGGASG